MLLPSDNLHVSLDTENRIPTKERLDRQLAEKGSGETPFMALKEIKKSKLNAVTSVRRVYWMIK